MTSKPPMKSEPIVHVRADSDSTLEDLFSIVNPGSKRTLQKPMRLRKLPPSFFMPPSAGPGSSSGSPVHSRENSVDTVLDPMSPGMQSVGSPPPQQPQQAQQQQQQQPPSVQPQQPFHSRAHSSPAQLQQSFAIAPHPSQQQQQHLHLRQTSYDVSTSADNLGPLPPGWEMNKTLQGQIYFINHINKTTQWEDPRKQLAQQQQQQMLAQQQEQQQSGVLPPGINSHHQRSISFDNLGPLPEGWEKSVTPEGEVYFLDHIRQRTTWIDPRLDPRGGLCQTGMTAEQKRQQNLRLQRLHNERQAMQRKQEELRQRMQNRSLSQENMQQAMNQTQEMLMRHSLGGDQPQQQHSMHHHHAMDPFLSSAVPTSLSQSELHNRQESADSGVGMGSNFNLGSIPEDLQDDSMDTGGNDLDTTLTEQTNGNAGGPNTNGVTSNANTSSRNNNDPPDVPEQLIPSLPPELGEVLSQDIMQDVLNTRNGSLTWL